MGEMPMDEGFGVVDENDDPEAEPEAEQDDALGDPELAELRDAFVEAWNDRNIERLLSLVVDDVDCPDVPGEGAVELADEVQGIWERSPGAILTRGSLGDESCAVAWLPDEDACWSRAALLCFDSAQGQITLVAVPDDPDALARTESSEPAGDELDAWLDWAEWERGEETVPKRRDRGRP